MKASAARCTNARGPGHEAPHAGDVEHAPLASAHHAPHEVVHKGHRGHKAGRHRLDLCTSTRGSPWREGGTNVVQKDGRCLGKKIVDATACGEVSRHEAHVDVAQARVRPVALFERFCEVTQLGPAVGDEKTVVPAACQLPRDVCTDARGGARDEHKVVARGARPRRGESLCSGAAGRRGEAAVTHESSRPWRSRRAPARMERRGGS